MPNTQEINNIVWSSYSIRWRQILFTVYIRFEKHGNSEICKRAVTIHFCYAMVTYKHSSTFGHHTTTPGHARKNLQQHREKDKASFATYLLRWRREEPNESWCIHRCRVALSNRIRLAHHDHNKRLFFYMDASETHCALITTQIPIDDIHLSKSDMNRYRVIQYSLPTRSTVGMSLKMRPTAWWS